MSALFDAYAEYLDRMYDRSWDLTAIDYIVRDASPAVYEWLTVAGSDDDYLDVPF